MDVADPLAGDPEDNDADERPLTEGQHHTALPEDPEVAGMLALMVRTDARRPARTGADGELVPLAEQDRALWDRSLIAEGVALITNALRRGQVGEYQVQAAIAAIHDQTDRHDDTDWSEILAPYGLLERMTANPMVTLNRAVAAARTTNLREQQYLTAEAGRLAAGATRGRAGW